MTTQLNLNLPPAEGHDLGRMLIFDAGKPRVDARTLHDLLPVTWDFSTWIGRRISSVLVPNGFQDSQGFGSRHLPRKGRGGRRPVDRWLSLAAARKIAEHEHRSANSKRICAYLDAIIIINSSDKNSELTVSPQCQSIATPDTGLAFIDLSRGIDEQAQRVDARTLHTFLGNGRSYADWFAQRVEEADLIENEDFGIYHKSVKNSGAGRPAIDHWLTLSAAKLMAILERNERGKQARRLFIMSEKKPAVQGGKVGLPGSYAAALRELANQVEAHEQLALDVATLDEARNQAISERAVADLEADIARTQAQHAIELRDRVQLELVAMESHSARIAATAAQEEKEKLEQLSANSRRNDATTLTKWLESNFDRLGLGPIQGRRVLNVIGILKSDRVGGCDNTDEYRLTNVARRSGALFEVDEQYPKRKRLVEGGPVVEVTDRDGNPVMVDAHVIYVDPDAGHEWLMRKITEAPESRLHRMLETQELSHGELRRLNGRYCIMSHDTSALDKLGPKLAASAILLSSENPGWRAQCTVFSSSKPPHNAIGRGFTLDDALIDLALNLYSK